MKKAKSGMIGILKLILFTGLTSVIVIVGINVITNWKNKQNSVTNNEQKNLTIKDGQLAIKINSVLNFDKPTGTALANIENNKNNLYDIIVKIYDEIENLIYESPKLKPGENIDKLKLDKTISSGSHKCTAYFEAYNEKNEFVGKTGTIIKVEIKG